MDLGRHFYLNKVLEQYAAKPATRMTLRQLVFFGRTLGRDRDKILKVSGGQAATDGQGGARPEDRESSSREGPTLLLRVQTTCVKSWLSGSHTAYVTCKRCPLWS